MIKRDLITKDFALYVVHHFASMQTWSKEEILAKIDRKINEANEDVVRCKDCKHWDKNEGECSHWYGFRENDFCSYGERKNDR